MLTRSLFRFSWALTVYGAQQAARLVAPRSRSGAGSSSTEAFDAVARAVEGQFGGVLRGAYEAGNDWLLGRGQSKAAAKP